MKRAVLHTVTLLANIVALQACTTLPRLEAVPPTQTARAIVPGFPNSRYWLNEDLPALLKEAIGDDKRERDSLARLGISTDPMPAAHVLAISGGGDAGAFAAGLLSGWNTHGTRPQFRLVTGTSAGALIAPFADPGPSYDDVIRTVATSVGPDDVFDRRNALVGLASDGMADSAPLARLVEKYVTPETLAAIAADTPRAGRCKLQPQTWTRPARDLEHGVNCGSQALGALELFRKIMVASASIRGECRLSCSMSKSMVSATRKCKAPWGWRRHSPDICLPAPHPEGMERATGQPFQRELHVYVILNGRMHPEWSETKRRTLAIGNRAKIRTLVQSQGIGDVDRIYATALEDGAESPSARHCLDFSYPHEKEFNTEYMKRLFEHSYYAAKGYSWHKVPPSEASPPRE